MNMYDCIIIGGGPAGLSAAIYLGRFNRSVLIIDRGNGRTATYEINENYLGFPEGIAARELTRRGVEQAKNFGAEIVHDTIESIDNDQEFFIARSKTSVYQAKTVILATGVTDLYPNIDHFKEYLGRTLFWCITCDGFKTIGKKVVIIGDTDDAACTATQFLEFTPHVTMVSNYPSGHSEISSTWLQRLHQANIRFVEGEISSVQGKNGMLRSITIDNGEDVLCDYVINQQGAVPNTSLAVQLGIQVNADGYIETDEQQRTNVPKVYAAGDVTRMFEHQIVTAAHEGATAACAANYDLYKPEQQMGEIDCDMPSV